MSTFVRSVPRDALEAIKIELTQKGREIFHLIVLGDQPLGEFLRLVNAESPTMRPPGHDVGLAGLGCVVQHGVERSGERSVALEFSSWLVSWMRLHEGTEGHVGVVVVLMDDFELGLGALSTLRQ